MPRRLLSLLSTRNLYYSSDRRNFDIYSPFQGNFSKWPRIIIKEQHIKWRGSLAVTSDGWVMQIWLTLVGLTIRKPVVFGNVARYFGKKREEDGHTHQWTVYLKPYRNEDMSAYVKKVHFKLHESYPNPNRVVQRPPYEVTETGWGEFEIIIKIYFHDPNEKAVTIYHLLKLFQSETDVMLGKKSLVAEFYDELIFQDPTTSMQQMLSNVRPICVGTYKHETDFEEKKERTLNNILTAKNKIRYEIAELNDRLKACKEANAKLEAEIGRLETEGTAEPEVVV